MTAGTRSADAVLRDIVRQHRKIQKLRHETIPAETRKLAEMIAATQDHPDVNYSDAARAMGTVRSFTQGLVHKLEAGELDPRPGNGQAE